MSAKACVIGNGSRQDCRWFRIAVRRPDQGRIHCRSFPNADDFRADVTHLVKRFVASDAPAIAALARSGLLIIATSKRVREKRSSSQSCPVLCSSLTRRIAISMFVTILFAAGIATAEEPTFDTTTNAFLKKHCLRCHSDSKQEGDFRVDSLDRDFSNPVAAQKWSEVLFRINAGEMPPPDEKQPNSKEIGHVADVISKQIRDGAATRMAKRGPVQLYRLSRSEYAHTVYDLLGVVFDVEAPGAFNEDPRWQGFDRVGALLSVAPSHVERYFAAANTVVEQAFPEKPVSSKTVRKHVGGGAESDGKRRLLQLGEGWSFSIAHPGRYRIRVRASGLPAFTGRAPRLSLWHKHHKRSFGDRTLDAAEDAPQTLEFEGLFPAAQYEIRNHARTKKHANGGIQLFRNEVIDAEQGLASLTGRERSPWTKVIDENGKPTTPLLLIDWVEIDGPLLTEADNAKRSNVIPEGDAERAEQRADLQRFAERAWRRPVTLDEIEPYVQLVAAEREAGESFRDAYRSALAAILVSRSFFNLEQGSPNENRRHLTDFELASRLSYFLWSSMPDDELLNAARDGKLTSPKGLSEQLERMLVDSKIDRFLDSFPKQWLQLHRVGMFQPDPGLYPNYGPDLEESMVRETTEYFAEMFRKNLPLREAIDSNWTMLDRRLALHYGVSQPATPTMSRVEVPSDSGRGGILTHASTLSLTSDGTRHRPVHRGAWLSETILAYTPPPPPPNVDPLEPVTVSETKTTIRSRLEAHATDANCVSCHAKIDPFGLAFENFDAIGRWRDVERVEGGQGDNPPVDASGTLPDGRTFSGPREFKKLLAANEKRLAYAFVEQLATYALRRVTTIDDEEQLQAIVNSAKEDGYGVRTLIRALVTSELFRQR